MQHLQPNTTLQGGKYRIERMLGQGGFGIPYLARNTVFDIDVAIKEFFMKDENDRDGSSVTMPNATKQELFYGQMEKFKKEAKRMFAIKNEHIVGVQDLFEENGTAYYVMDYVDGENLAERLKRTGKPMSEQEVRDILPQILDALKSIHDAGIWHLDLKPANIMIDKNGCVKLIDFGASKQLNAQKGGATTSTAISYTNGYAPREQMEQNYEKFGPWTDIYALGATLYALLTNKRPPLPTDIDDDSSEDKHIALPFPYSISENIRGLVLSMMNTNRIQRPQKVESIISYLTESSLFVQDIPNEETIIASDKVNKDTLIEMLRKRAENGDAEAQNELGYCYYCGENIEEDKGLAFFWFKKAAEQGNVKAQLNLAHSYEVGEGVEEDIQTAFEWFKIAAEKDFPLAQRELGRLYEYGKGVERDRVLASRWYEKAAEQGDAHAQLLLAQCYDYGKGVRKDKQKAIEWYKKAAEQGIVDAQFKLGWCYVNGVGVEKNEKSAFAWYKKAAEQGNPAAQNNLGCCYENGDGVEKNKEKAFEWYKKAAEQGDSVAQNNIGNCYDKGSGVEEDKEKAIEWYIKSAEQGCAEAQYNLGWHYDKGIGIEENKEKAFEWYKESAEQGKDYAQYQVALCYDKGIGVKEDKQEALEWYKKAAKQDNEDAIKILMPLFRKALRKRCFYRWKGITIFASWFSAYVYLFWVFCVICMIFSWIEKICGMIGVNIWFSLDSLNDMPIIIPISFISLFILSLISMFLLDFLYSKQSRAYWKATEDSGIIIPYDKVDNGPYFMTCW